MNPLARLSRKDLKFHATACILGAMPLCIVLGFRTYMSHQGPKAASASKVAAADAPNAPASLLLVSAQHKALLDIYASFPPVRETPMHQEPSMVPRSKPNQGTQTTPQATETAPAHPDAPLELKVTAIMRGQGIARAVISGKLRKVGDQIAPGWILTAIGSTEDSVTLQSASGQTRTLTIIPPAIKEDR